jgi:small subunit ribosomal protein S2
MLDYTKLPNKAPDYNLENLFELGCHFGHQRRKWNPKMKKYIYTTKASVHIFDLEKTVEQLKLAYNYAYSLGKAGKSVIMVGTKRQAKEIIKQAAEEAGVSYINSRWLGGFLTNWEQVSKSLRRMTEIEDGLNTDKYKGYTKFERVQLEKEMSRLKRFFIGLKDIKGKPDCIFVVDPKREKIVVTEAKQVGVSVMALIDSNGDPSKIDLPIPANDDSVKSVEFIVGEIAKAYKAGKEDK